MKIYVAKEAGFCPGVKRAIKIAEDELLKGPAWSIGPLIHNEQEIERLSKKGLITEQENIVHKPKETNDVIIIRSHGIGSYKQEALISNGWRIVDATCPFVRKAQEIARKSMVEGYQIIILGDSDHPEVKGINEWTDNRAIVVSGESDFQDLVIENKVAVLSQTTEKEYKFQKLVEYIKTQATEVKVYDTICQASKNRQNSAKEVAEKAEIMLIIGGRNSSNTNKLYELCRSINNNSYLIEKADEIEPSWLLNKNSVGITAGASTPAWIIEEVIMSIEEKDVQDSQPEQEFAEMILDFKSCRRGDIVRGTVIKVTPDEVMLDIGGKSEGIIPSNELSFRRVDPREFTSIGQELVAEVIKEDKEGNILLSHKRAINEIYIDQIEKAKELGSIICAPVIEVVKSGLLVDLGIRGFVPASQVDRSYVEDLQKYLGQNLRMKVLEFDRRTKKAVLSQRVVLEEEHKNKLEELWSKLSEGQVYLGKVVRLTDFGAFVDIGGADGLLHLSEMSWGRTDKPSDIVSVGDEIEVSIIKIDPTKRKIALSMKALSKDPWDKADEKYQVGLTVKGKVARIAPFGAFVEIEPGLDGLVHISQLSSLRVKKVEDVLQIGQIIDVRVLDIDPTKKRMSLSMKESDEIETEKISEEASEMINIE